jgi:hypothetical protein
MAFYVTLKSIILTKKNHEKPTKTKHAHLEIYYGPKGPVVLL